MTLINSDFKVGRLKTSATLNINFSKSLKFTVGSRIAFLLGIFNSFLKLKGSFSVSYITGNVSGMKAFG